MVVANRIRAEALARVIARAQHVDAAQDRVQNMVIALPISYCFALVNQWVLAHIHDLPMTFGGFSQPDRLAQILEQAEDSMICLVGAQAGLLRLLGDSRRFANVRRVAFAGSPFPWGQAALLKRLFPNARFYNNYGCAEAMPRLVVTEVTENLRRGDPGLPGLLGQPLPGIRFRTTPQAELQFQSDYAALGYVTPEGYAPFAADGWIDTGDCAEQDDRLGWVLQGRSSEVFKRHGEKVSPARLARTIEEIWPHPFALLRRQDRAGEAGLALALEGAADRAAARNMLKAIRDRHPRAYWPLRILRFDTFPRLRNEKIDIATLESLCEQDVLWDQRV